MSRAHRRARTGAIGAAVISSLLLAGTPAGAVVVRVTGARDAGLLARRVSVVAPDPGVAATARAPAARVAATSRRQASARAAALDASSSAFPAGYESLIDRYFTDVATDPRPSNVYSVAAQYGDTLDQPLGSVDNLSRTYHVSFNAATDTFDDSQPYPADRDSSIGGVGHDNAHGCAPDPADALGDPAYTWCLTDGQIQSELTRVIAAQQWPTASMSAIYFIFLPAQIDVCMDSSDAQCAGHPDPASGFCAYHSSYGTNDPTPPLYAVLPYGDVSGCRTGEAPNGGGATDDDPGDDETSMISHEHNETIDDPFGNAWLDSQGYESADLCAGFGTTPAAFGSAAGPAGQEYNQVINGDDYYLQDEFADLDPNDQGKPFDACEQHPGGTADLPLSASMAVNYHGGPVVDAHTVYAIFWDPAAAATPPTPAVSVSSSVTHVGQAVTFNASASQGSNLSYSWSFGDGQTATGAVVTHDYTAGGTFAVTVTVLDDQTQYYATAQQPEVVYANPVATFTSPSGTVAPGATVDFDATGATSADGPPTYAWSFGDGTTATGGPTTQHAYTLTGDYTVTLTVTDAAGATASTSRVVHVQSPAPATSGGTSGAARRPHLARKGKPRLALSGGRVILISGEKVTCPAGRSACKVTIAVTAAAAAGGGGRGAQSRGAVAVGSATVTVAAGRKRKIRVRVNSRGRNILLRDRVIRATVRITARAGASADAAATTITRTLSAPMGLRT